MATTGGIELSTDDLREVTGYAARCAEQVLEIVEAVRPDDVRPREAVDAAWAFARGGPRGKALRDTAWAALRAAKEAEQPDAAEAARAAMAAAGAAYLHPIADAHQVKHILGSAAHAAHAAQLAAGGDESAAVARLVAARSFTTSALVDVLRRYPPAPGGGGRVGELVRLLDASLRDGERR
ncbi:putative immunity protein [Cellulosimicrobium protaetiae]|uniref:Exonuclease SbcC n=1 Tax=Cellulosimicrobium protaetiae TaxID=2587808 RepID=A0A6M5UE11_9MICO|nr:exonuclease SbcC [Cellulosimicrobium protaetiae]QJW36736.1 exonuclease SbcC [Cellulosimicrobium protaetiae]